MPDILVVGSLNADLVVRVPRFPQPGETISGEDLKIIPGGKGANQAVAAARQGTSVAMLGRVGNDSFGPELRTISSEIKWTPRSFKSIRTLRPVRPLSWWMQVGKITLSYRRVVTAG